MQSPQKMSLHYKHNGFSLIELLVYLAIFSVVASVVWQGIKWAQGRDTQMDTFVKISSNSGAGLNTLNQAIASALFPPKIINAPTGSGIFANTQCLEVTKRISDGSNTTITFWLGLDSATQHYSLYKASTLCNAIPANNNLKKLTDPLFIKIDGTKDFFISAGDNIQFNFKTHKAVGKTNYEIKQNEASETKRFIKLSGTQGCKISSSTSLFNGSAPSTALEVVITDNLNASLDRLKFKYAAISLLCNAPASPTALNANLTCAFDTSTGSLKFISTEAMTGEDWAKIVSDVEYAPAVSTSTALLKGTTRTLNFKLGNISQGNMTLDLYPLARSCADANFAP